MIITKQPSLVDMVAEYERTIGMLLAALRKAEAHLEQPVLHTQSGDGVANILRADIRGALGAIRAAIAAATGEDGG